MLIYSFQFSVASLQLYYWELDTEYWKLEKKSKRRFFVDAVHIAECDTDLFDGGVGGDGFDDGGHGVFFCLGCFFEFLE